MRCGSVRLAASFQADKLENSASFIEFELLLWTPTALQFAIEAAARCAASIPRPATIPIPLRAMPHGSFWSIRAELKLRVSQPSSGHNAAIAYSFGLPVAAVAGSRARNRSAAPSPGRRRAENCHNGMTSSRLKTVSARPFAAWDLARPAIFLSGSRGGTVLRVATGRPHCPSWAPVALSSAAPNGSPQPIGRYLL